MSKDTKSVIDEFHQAVNMTPREIESWLKTAESKEVGQKDGKEETIGHKYGQKIMEILNKKQDEYDDDDLTHMKKVVSYVHRHSAQKPYKDIEHSRWLYSLKNWGHDPLK